MVNGGLTGLTTQHDTEKRRQSFLIWPIFNRNFTFKWVKVSMFHLILCFFRDPRRSESIRVDPSWPDPDWRSELIRSDFCTCLKRADANKANPTALGFRDNVSLTAVRVFEHLTPRLQEVLYEANKFKTQYHYKYCWAKNGTVYLRKSDDSRATRIKDVSDLTGIQRWR